MEVIPPDTLRLAQELAAAYRVLECTVPAMLRELYRGGVSSLDQLSFHESVGKLSEFTDIIDYDDGRENYRRMLTAAPASERRSTIWKMK